VRQGEHAVAGGESLSELQFFDDGCPEPGLAAGPADANTPVVELVAPAVQHLAVEAHQEPHLVGGAFPVLGGERVDAEVLHPDLDGAGDDVQQGGLPGAVSLDPGESAAVGPPAVAVHDDGDVAGYRGGR
jgi:hypothetical protein